MKESEVPKAESLGEWAYLAIEKHFEKTLKHEADVLKDRDPEALHQMRVGMRRLRSAVTGFAPALELPKAAGESKIAKIARRLGALRDLDVMLEALERRYRPSLPPEEHEELDTALERLAKQRREAFSHVRETLHAQPYKKLKQALKEWLKKPVYQEIAQLPIQDALPDLLLPQVSRLFLEPGWLVGVRVFEAEIPLSEELKLKAVEEILASRGPLAHSLRKQVKRVRYQMSLFNRLYGPSYAAWVEEMKEIQEVLGEIQDSLVLAEVLGDVLGEEIDTALPALAQKLAQTRCEAWQKWQPLQQRYLSRETRRALRCELLLPLEVSANGQVPAVAEPADGAMN
ncbi:CHAD domain-containing protein [Kamptonema formosum]|uniref:CHAD domain-containing protein n=1 Tax=Kamptonema formosum TaxID=331992 RepID=UPI0003482B27|nr:CHAD domain-containing protein [Oscillatoria sp. PCC 10802]